MYRPHGLVALDTSGSNQNIEPTRKLLEMRFEGDACPRTSNGGKERRPSVSGGKLKSCCEVAAARIAFHHHRPAPCRPCCSDETSEGGHPRGAFYRNKADDRHERLPAAAEDCGRTWGRLGAGSRAGRDGRE